MAKVISFLKTPVKCIVNRHSVALARRATLNVTQADGAPLDTPSQCCLFAFPLNDLRLKLKSESIDLKIPQAKLTSCDTPPQSYLLTFPPVALKPCCRLELPLVKFLTPKVEVPSSSSSRSSITPQNALKNFRSLEPFKPQNVDSKISHLSNASKFTLGFPRTFFFKRTPKKQSGPKKRRVPKLILLQNPFTWLMIKIDFSVLRNIWDPTFREKDFKYGTKQAISRVTNVISQGQYSELNGLLTKAARVSLKKELDRNWSERQRALLALKKEDIQISSPRKVYFIRIADKKFCDVDMAFLALKWTPINDIDALIFTEIFARFHREYTPHCIPEWTIAYFKVTRFEVLRRK